MSAFAQDGYRVRFDWGLVGAEELIRADPEHAVVVVVDVLSFSTTVSVGVDVGIEVYPFRWRDDRAEAFAAGIGAHLAGGRSDGGLSLSPVSLRAATGVQRLVLPSPNGATICYETAQHGATVIAGCLRNARAVAGRAAHQLHRDERTTLAVIAAGERWPDGSLRPAVEDVWGAGAILAGLAAAGVAGLSPEALAAAGTFAAISADVGTALRECVSGRELSEYGFAQDVAVAAELNETDLVAVLSDGRFTTAPRAS